MQWKKTMWTLWAAQFTMTAGMSLVIPFLPLYIAELGIHNVSALERWSGWVFAANFITAFLFQPIWGSLADRYGRKVMMLRSIFGMCVVVFLMGLVTAPWQLLVLRLINGVFAGFISMAVSLQASITPTEHSGRALGTLQTGAVGGMLIGPLAGGFLAERIGYSHVFIFTSVILFLGGFLVMIFVKEDRTKLHKRKPKERTEWKLVLPLMPVFIASFVTQLGMMSIEPIVTIYAKLLYHGSNLEIIAGLVVATSGIANIIGSPTLGRIGDKIGQRKTLIIAFSMAALAFVPQALAHGIGLLLVGRFLLGLFVGGMIPSLNVLVKKMAPKRIQATAFGFNTSFLFLGNLIGPLLGGQIAAQYGIRSVFYVTMSILLANVIFLLFNRNLGSVKITADSTAEGR